MSKFKLSEFNLTNEIGWAALHLAVASDNLSLAREIIKAGANVNQLTLDKESFSPLVLAINNGNLEIIHLLLEYGANVNLAVGDGNTPFMIAIQRPVPFLALEMASTLIDAGADVSVFANGKMKALCTKLKLSKALKASLVKLVETNLIEQQEESIIPKEKLYNYSEENIDINVNEGILTGDFKDNTEDLI